MKKILTSIFALGIALSLSACFGAKSTDNGSSKKTESSQGGESQQTEVVLEDKNSYSWAVHGNHLLADETPNGWNGKDNELYEKSKMTAISVAEAKRIDNAVGTALEGKDVKYLYKYEGLILGVNDAGWKTNFKMNDKMYKANGSYCFKAVKLSYDAEEEVYAEEQWIPHDHDGHTEALTNNLWVSPTFAEEPDADGFSWDYNPVAMEAGVFTLIVAEYNAAPSATVCNYGIALVKTAEKAGQEFEEIVDFVADEHEYSLAGSWDANWGVDYDMHATAGVWEYTFTDAAADTQFKVRVDHSWDTNFGYEIVDAAASSEAVANEGGNIKLTAAGSYKVTLSFTNNSLPAKLVIAAVA